MIHLETVFDSFTQLIYSVTKQVTIFMNESLHNLLNRFIHKC